MSPQNIQMAELKEEEKQEEEGRCIFPLEVDHIVFHCLHFVYRKLNK